MKKIYITLLSFFTLFSYSQTLNIPDANFKATLISQGYDSNKDGNIQKSEIDAVINLDISDKGIADLTGIENFRGLFILNCSKNRISRIDLSKNTYLTQLDISSNQLDTLELSKNVMLFSLKCGENKLSALDLASNSSISVLSCNNNRISKLDLLQIPSIYQLDCSYNHLIALDLSKASNLSTLICSYNIISGKLDFAGSTGLEHLDCSSNKITSLNLKGLPLLTQVNVSNNPDLTYICVNDAVYASANALYIKDATAQWTDNCLITSFDDHISDLINVSPNPATENFILTLPMLSNVTVTTIEGNIIESFDDIQNLSFGTDYKPGIYIVSVYANKHTWVKRVAKL